MANNGPLYRSDSVSDSSLNSHTPLTVRPGDYGPPPPFGSTTTLNPPYEADNEKGGFVPPSSEDTSAQPHKGMHTPRANSTDNALEFADGDGFIGQTKAGRSWLKLLSSSMVLRWLLYILPVEALIWIPGVVQIAFVPDATILSVKLLFWSIYMSVFWLGWWGSQAAAMLLPKILHAFLGVLAPEWRPYVNFFKAIRRYIGYGVWALVNWVAFEQLIDNQGNSDKSEGDGKVTSEMSTAWFGFWVSFAILAAEKLAIQVIAHNYHERAFADRIEQQTKSIKNLTVLYANSKQLQEDEQESDPTLAQAMNPMRLLKGALKGVRKVAKTGVSAIGVVASEMAGERVLQPNSPSSKVISALATPEKSLALARRIFYNFSGGDREIQFEELASFFSSQTEAMEAFELFDRDFNGNASLQEVELAVVELGREREALLHSMADLDSAVGRLDAVLVSVWYIVALFILLALLVASFESMITSAGTFILGLSWLIGESSSELLSSSIFLFVKHPYDVGDMIQVNGKSYIVRELHLLSTILQSLDGTLVQLTNKNANNLWIRNVRRSGPIAETYTFAVEWETPMDKINALRERMLEFLKAEKRDFIPEFDVNVMDYKNLDQLVLSADIKYKSNLQNDALKWSRRNKWLLALRAALMSLEITGPPLETVSVQPAAPAEPGSDQTQGGTGSAESSDAPRPFDPRRLSRQASRLQSDNAVFRDRAQHGLTHRTSVLGGVPGGFAPVPEGEAYASGASLQRSSSTAQNSELGNPFNNPYSTSLR